MNVAIAILFVAAAVLALGTIAHSIRTMRPMWVALRASDKPLVIHHRSIG